MKQNELDEIDRKILRLLEENARISYSEIGEKVGLTRTGAQKRIRSLEEKGIIQGYRTEISLTERPDATFFYAYIETTPDRYEEIGQKLKEELFVRALFETAGSSSYLALCVTETKEERAEFRHRINHDYPGIVSFSVRDIWKIDKGRL